MFKVPEPVQQNETTRLRHVLKYKHLKLTDTADRKTTLRYLTPSLCSLALVGVSMITADAFFLV